MTPSLLPRLWRDLFLGAMGLFLALPLVVVAAVSLNEKRRLVFPPENVTLKWYGYFFDDAAWMNALENSLTVAFLAATVATSIALPLAYALWQFAGRYVRLLSLLGAIPFMMPPVIIAIGFLLFWGTVRHVGQIENTVLSHGVLLTALPLITISVGLASIDRLLIDAAGTLGARPDTVFRTVVLPIVLPYVLSGFCFVLVFSLNEYIVAYMVAGFSVETLPIKMLNSLRGGFTPAMAVGSVLFMIGGLVIFSAVALFGDLPKLLGAEKASDPH